MAKFVDKTRNVFCISNFANVSSTLGKIRGITDTDLKAFGEKVGNFTGSLERV